MRSGNWSAPLQLVSSFLNIIWLSWNAMAVISRCLSPKVTIKVFLSSFSTSFNTFHRFSLFLIFFWEMFPCQFPFMMYIKLRTWGPKRNRFSIMTLHPSEISGKLMIICTSKRFFHFFFSIKWTKGDWVQLHPVAASVMQPFFFPKSAFAVQILHENSFLSRKKPPQAQRAGISSCCCTTGVTLGIACFRSLRRLLP